MATNTATNALGKQFQQAQKQLKVLARGIKQIGTRNDSAALRAKMDVLVAAFKDDTKAISKALRSAESGPATSKLAKDLRVLVRNFEEKTKARAQMERKNPLPEPAAGIAVGLSGGGGGGGGGGEGGDGDWDMRQQKQHQQHQQQRQQFELIATNKLETERQIALEQQSALQNIQRDVLTTRDIMQDINILIEEQGEDLNVMEANVTQASDSVERGVAEVRKATVYQKSARKKKCILLVVVLVILGIILISVIVTQVNNA
jgi:hypothetical protein